MKITVKLFANLVQYSPNPSYSGAPFSLEVETGSTLSDLAAQLNLPGDLVKVMFVNGIICEPDQVLKENDVVGIFPPVGGGSK
jgi:sulfur-carrier protein